MTKPYRPGAEIQLDVPMSSMKFFAKAMSIDEQLTHEEREKEAEREDENGNKNKIETDELIQIVLGRLTRTEPPIEMTSKGLRGAIDLTVLWRLNAAMRFNLSYEEKKS